MSIHDSLVRVAVGVEEPDDYFGDFEVVITGGNGWEFG